MPINIKDLKLGAPLDVHSGHKTNWAIYEYDENPANKLADEIKPSHEDKSTIKDEPSKPTSRLKLKVVAKEKRSHATIEEKLVSAEQPNSSFGAKEGNSIFKANKNNKEMLSILEVGISAVWEANVGATTTPPCDLIIEEKSKNDVVVLGVISKKLLDWKPLGEKIEHLTDEHKAQLAQILTMCYCLEEDDLHRNNIGTATDPETGKTIMAKIDHDMSFYQSFTSTSENRRRYVRLNDENRFKVTSRDIRDFPVLKDADIHYWPTTTRIAKLEGSPGYTQHDELRSMFSALKDDPIFIEAKYKALFNFVNKPVSDVKEKIIQRLGPNHPQVVGLISNAFVARQAEVRANLLATPEAITYLRAHPEYVRNGYMPASQENPLIAAIRCNSLAHLNINKYKEFLDKPNSEGTTPLQVAVQQLSSNAKLYRPIKQLLRAGLQVEKSVKAELKEKISLAEKSETAEFHYEIKKLLAVDHSDPVNVANEQLNIILNNSDKLSLSEMKQKALICIKTIAESIEKPGQLNRLFELVNSDKYKFIKQLQSSFWVIRQIRGSHGLTTNYKSMIVHLQSCAEKLSQKNLSVDEKENLKDLKAKLEPITTSIQSRFTETAKVDLNFSPKPT